MTKVLKDITNIGVEIKRYKRRSAKHVKRKGEKRLTGIKAWFGFLVS